MITAEESGAVAGILEPLHSMIYFVPEADERYVAAGLESGRMGYFAPRAAPLGPVGAGLVAALFYNFAPDVVAQFLPAAWSRASPADLVAARYDAADAALHRVFGAEALAAPEIAEAAGLARTAALACPVEGRPMAAALLDLDWPAAPHMALWHGVSIVREHRGDGHFTACGSRGLSGIEALVTFTATGTGYVMPFARESRGWTGQQWDDAEAALRDRGLLDSSGALTGQGWELRARVESDTDALGHRPWAALGSDGTARLGEVGGRMVAAMLAGGVFPEGRFGPDSPRNPARARRG
ncbi:hypothetical protein EV383_2283 [Pseudonocardia sediminis]|uniref:SalK n=1 Tax=Pseudonocardia sediminis TaxID=1397368 RepID=A0A4Q7UWP1_PSEST|nr:hypothetical protein [Pseudonocardia sediminis]RZT85418.1 hypothetical protein EV383_2283 [Pseudonocardia sediminis]